MTVIRSITQMLAHDAERKGTTFEQEFSEFMDEMQRAEEEEYQRLKRDGLEIIQAAVKLENDDRAEQLAVERDAGSEIEPGEFDPVPMPVEIVAYRSIDPAASLGPENEERIEAVAKKPDGTEGVIVYRYWSYAGTRLEPPEHELEVYWE